MPGPARSMASLNDDGEDDVVIYIMMKCLFVWLSVTKNHDLLL